MRINTNVSSLTAQEASQNTSKRITTSLEKLSTGLRINKASDDASGLAIADKLRTQATSINQGISNGNSAVALLQIADKSMAEQSNILDTIKSKLIQANTDTTSADGRESIRKDITKLLEQLDNIAKQTNYNGNVLLQAGAGDSAKSSSLKFQIGETNQDIITNDSIQSNTNGLGSKVSYGTSTTITAGATSQVLASTGAISINGADANGSGVAENITLNGDVDSISLKTGMTIKDADTATAAKLDALVTANKATSSSGTYTMTADATLDLSDIDNVQATLTSVAPSTNGGSTPTNISISQGQVVDTRSGTVTSGSDLDKKLNDTNLFTKLTTGLYVSIAAAGTTVSGLATGESFKLNDTVEVASEASGSTAGKYSPGDTITVTGMATGGLLDKALNDTSMFDKISTGVYKVKEDYTAGKLSLMQGESISIQNGTAVTLGAKASGLTEANLKYNAGGVTAGAPTVYRENGSGTAVLTTGITGSILYASGEDTISFDITGGGTSGATNFSVKAGDIITLTTDSATTGKTDNLSKSLMEGTGFIALGNDKYQAKADTTLSMDNLDAISVTRLVGGVATPSVVNGPAAAAQNSAIANDKVVSYQNSSATTVADTSISLTIGDGATIKNNNATAGNILTVSSTGDLTNGKDNLDTISALGTGELTAQLASDFQSIIDDSITKLNGYRGDIGSTQNQVESAVRNLMTQATNVKAAESIIRDVDYAAESANFNKQNIISQAGSYAISQSNAVQQNVLRLLQ